MNGYRVANDMEYKLYQEITGPSVAMMENGAGMRELEQAVKIAEARLERLGMVTTQAGLLVRDDQDILDTDDLAAAAARLKMHSILNRVMQAP